MPGLGGGGLEDNILAMLCYSEAHAHAISLEISVDLFATRHFRRIAERAISYLEQYGRPPRVHLRDLFERELVRADDDGDLYRAVINAIEEIADHLDADYVLQQLERWKLQRQMEVKLNELQTLIDTGNIEEAQAQFHISGDTTRGHNGVWFKDTQRWLSFMGPGDEGYFSAGVDTLDEYKILLRKGETLLMIAPTGKGKSWHLIEVGRRALLHRRNVLHISLENSLEVCQQRWTQTLLGLSRDDILNLQVTLFKRDSQGLYLGVESSAAHPQSIARIDKVALAKRLEPIQRLGQLRVEWFPSASVTVGQLNAHLEFLERTEGFRPDVVTLDYLDQMALDARNLRISKGQVYRELRGLAGKRRFALFTATQGNRDSATARLVTGTNVSEDWSVCGTADIVLTYSQTGEELAKGLARVFVDKARNEKDRWIALVTQSYGTGQFCLDSVYFNEVKEDIRRFISPEEE